MFGKGKKPVSIAYKEKLLAEIAHYEKRIEEALNKRRQISFQDNSIEENINNPYKLNNKPSENELKQQEASLRERVSMTLELGMLTIMQSEVNVMVTPPEVRKPVPEDGVWYDVAAECKIDLVPFTITFYAHKPHRRFGPTRYRDVVVTPVKPAQQKELAQSILSKLHLPNLALQVLKSYATAFRSRRTTLLELAEKYADKLRMQEMPEGGYRVQFLDLLQVDWTLENLWSPVVPFCHRMKFEVEYMPKDYIQAIGKLYKQFKDPSLVTSERTLLLSRILDICDEAAGPARQLQESLDSDPDTAGRLHERRTTIDQEPDVPQVEHSAKKKKTSGKENKPQNRKTSMAPPKTIPKRAKNSKPNDKDLNENRKSVKRVTEGDSGNVSKKSRFGDNDNTKSKPGLKGGRGNSKATLQRVDGLETNEINRDNGTDDQNKKDTGKDSNTLETEVVSSVNAKKKSNKVNAKSNATSYTRKDTGNEVAANVAETEVAGLENGKNKSNKVNAKNTKEATASKASDDKIIKSKVTGNMEDRENNGKNNKDAVSSKGSEASSKGSKKVEAKTKDKVTKSKEINTENNAARTKRSADYIVDIENEKATNNNTNKVKDVETNVVSSKKGVENKANTQKEKRTDINILSSKDTAKENAVRAEKGESVQNKVASKVAGAKDKDCVASTKQGAKNNEHNADQVPFKETQASKGAVTKNKASSKENPKNTANTKVNAANNEIIKTRKANDANPFSKTSSEIVASKDNNGKIEAASKKTKDTNNANTLNRKAVTNAEKETLVGKISQNPGKNKVIKKTIQEDSNTAKKKVVGSNTIKDKLMENVKPQTLKETERVIEKNKVVKEKTTEIEKNPEKNDVSKETRLAEKRKVANPKITEQTEFDKTKTVNTITKASSTHKTEQDAVLAKKRKTDSDSDKQNKNDYDNPKKSTTNIDKPRNGTKVLNTTIVLKERTNIEKSQENQQKKSNSMRNVPISKPKIVPISKQQAEKLDKMADKLKTKIPIMKSKISFSSLGEKMKINNLGSASGVGKTKIPQKSWPVFKMIGKGVPTRISPRKLPTFKPHGFSNK